MKPTRFFLLFILFIYFVPTFAQDTIFNSTDSNSKYKIGVKYIRERSGDHSLMPEDYPVNSVGIQGIRKLSKKVSIESGVYRTSKANAAYQKTPDGIFLYHSLFRHIWIPFNYRVDTKVIYASVGPFIDYLVNTNNSKAFYAADDSRKLNFGYNINCGIEKSINKQLSILIEGRYSNTVTSSSVRTRYFRPSYINYGFAIGLNYKFLRPV